MAKHIYVIDTCVLLHDPHCLFKFEDNDIYIALAVLDDLDGIKTLKESVGWAAREVFRILEQFSLTDLKDKGVSLGEKMGRLFVYNHEAPLSKGEMPNIVKTNSDNALIQVCSMLKAKFPKRKVAIVTKDMGLRMRAITWGCVAENYKNDLIEKTDFENIKEIDITEHQDWETLSSKKKEDGYKIILLNSFTKELQSKIGTPYPNEFIKFKRGDSMDCYAIYKKNAFDDDGFLKVLKDKNSYKYSGITPLNAEQKMAMEVIADPDVQMVSLCGRAGSGKTLLALSIALEMIDDGLYNKIVFIKPLVPVGGKDIGFLPGSKEEKISAWLGPVKDNLETLIQKKHKNTTENVPDALKEMIDSGIIEVEAMTFLQGRSIQNAIIIADETQNLTKREGRMLVERCGNNSKVIMLGDLSQIENPYLDRWSCALAHAMNGGKHLDVTAAVKLTRVERSKLAEASSEIFAQRLGL